MVYKWAIPSPLSPETKGTMSQYIRKIDGKSANQAPLNKHRGGARPTMIMRLQALRRSLRRGPWQTLIS
eukprot:3176306-Pleurochrysis_carterae.AAC.1